MKVGVTVRALVRDEIGSPKSNDLFKSKFGSDPVIRQRG